MLNRFVSAAALVLLMLGLSAQAAPPEGKGKGNNNNNNDSTSLTPVSTEHWDRTAVRRVLNAFAFGGLATEAQLDAWAAMAPEAAVAEMLSFDAVNPLLSPPDESAGSVDHCHSIEAMQGFWSGDDAGNRMKYTDRHRYATLSGNGSLSTSNLQRTWTKVISTRGCNPFLHKMAFYLTNYHASISAHKTRSGLIRSYYDDLLAALGGSGDFIEVMTIAASHAAVARAYGHQYNQFNNNRESFSGNDDFAREIHQLFFRIYGDTEDPAYHEDTTIEHSAWLLSGMNLDKVQGAYGSTSSGDWYVSPLDFTDHYDSHSSPRYIRNYSRHYHSNEGAGSCLEILHEPICGATADIKIAALAPVAARHVESLENVPVYMIDFFADDNLDADKVSAIRAAWVEADFDLLAFIRRYAVSTAFHDENTFKYRTAFDRNLVFQNLQILTNEENFAKHHTDSPYYRMRDQGAEAFEPAHDVFGGQTGYQAANSRYVFRDAFWQNFENPTFFDDVSDEYTLTPGTDTEPAPVYVWNKDWRSAIPLNATAGHRVDEVAGWLWSRFIADGGKNLDAIARAQIHAMLATGHDLAWAVNSDQPDRVFTSRDITHKRGDAHAADQAHAAYLMSELSDYAFNKRIGLVINFVSLLPYAFAMEGR